MTQQITSSINDPALAELGQDRIEWSDRSMPVLRDIRRRFEIEQPFEGLRIAACMHVTTETGNLMRTLRAGGAEVALCGSNPRSTQDHTAAALAEVYGIHVFARHGIDVDAYYGQIDQALEIRPHLVFDDGCDLVNTLHSRRRDLLDGIRAGCEETTTGVHRLRQMAADGALSFPMVAVNDTDTKHMFDNRYGTGQSALDGVVRATNVLLAGKTVVVAGFGYCGQGIAERAAGLGARVIVTEVDPTRALDAAMQGFSVMPMEQAAPLGDIFLTVTSNARVLIGEHFELMRDGAILANAGHFDVEIDLSTLRELATEVSPVRPEAEQYTLGSGRRLIVLGQGRLVNLVAAEGHPASVMDMSFADQALVGEWLAGDGADLAPGVHAVPQEIDRAVARLKLEAMGLEIDTMRSDQVEYVNSWNVGS